MLGKRARADEEKKDDDVHTISDELDGMHIDGADHIDGD
jgi:hypothetical protein